MSNKYRGLNSNKLNQTQQLSKKHINSSDPYSNTGEKNPYSGTEEELSNTQKIILHNNMKKKEKINLSKSFETEGHNNFFPNTNKSNGNCSKSRNILELSNLSLNSNKSCKSQTTNFKPTYSKFTLSGDVSKQRVINRIRARKKKLLSSINKEHPYLECTAPVFNKTSIIKDLFDNDSYTDN